MRGTKRSATILKEEEAVQRYLVLGGNGFIGSHIVDRLAEQGHSVKVLDPFRRQPQFNTGKNTQIIKGSAFDPLDLGKALHNVTHVIYCLAGTNPFTADTDPYADIENLRHGVAILESCVLSGVKKVGFISSGGAVYGRIAEKKIAHEDDVPLPVSPYGICKLAMEHYLEYFQRKYGLGYVVYRLSNPYGPRQAFKREQGVIAAFMKQIADEEQITIYGDGKASRDYIYVQDAARMIADTIGKENNHAVYNIGSGEQTTLNEIISGLERAFARKVTTMFVEAPRTTLQKTGLSIERFTEEFGGPGLESFEVGLQKTFQHFKDQVSQSNEGALDLDVNKQALIIT